MAQAKTPQSRITSAQPALADTPPTEPPAGTPTANTAPGDCIGPASANTPEAPEPVASPEPDRRLVRVEDGEQHGYVGHRPRTTPNSAFTVAGVTDVTAHVDDEPRSAQTTRRP